MLVNDCASISCPLSSAAVQWDILKMSGIPEEELPQFADPLHWLRYFPPLAMRDLTSMGCGIDWRRRCGARAASAIRVDRIWTSRPCVPARCHVHLH